VTAAPPTPRPTGRKTAADAPLAVALRYALNVDEAPKVVAKGEGPMAERIVALAREHGVSVREDADLVRLLSSIELDSPIPVEAFAAVAEILSYIYRAKGQPRTAKP
jgi:flagellar biosynthesis protein